MLWSCTPDLGGLYTGATGANNVWAAEYACQHTKKYFSTCGGGVGNTNVLHTPFMVGFWGFCTPLGLTGGGNCDKTKAPCRSGQKSGSKAIAPLAPSAPPGAGTKDHNGIKGAFFVT